MTETWELILFQDLAADYQHNPNHSLEYHLLQCLLCALVERMFGGLLALIDFSNVISYFPNVYF